MSDEFYVGYHDQSPPNTARFVRRIVVAAGSLVVALMALVAARQTAADPGFFEFGVARDFDGVLFEKPLPTLRTLTADSALTNYLLVGFGKRGLPDFARGQDGQSVRFKGSLIQKGASVMIEMNDPRSFSVADPSPNAARRPASESLGPVVLTGELVDTKCYFGVMRPAVGKVHRACAVRCLSGGVPPGLLVRGVDGRAVVVLLAGAGASPLRFEVQWAARTVIAEGALENHEGIPVLRTTRLSLASP